MRRPDLVVAEPGPSEGEPELVQRQVLLHPHGERQRHHFEVEGAGVPRGHLVEAVAVVGDDAGEHVDTTRRALGIGLASQAGGQVEALLQLHEVRAAGLEHGPVAAEVDLVEDVVLELALDRVGARQEAAADAQRPLPQPQVEAGRLDVAARDLEAARVHVTGPDGLFEELAREHALGGREAQHRHAVLDRTVSKARGGGHGEGPPSGRFGHRLWMTWGRTRLDRWGLARYAELVHRADGLRRSGPPAAGRAAAGWSGHRIGPAIS